MDYVIVKYLHLMGIIILFSTLLIQHVLLKKEMTPDELGKLGRIDLIYGISAGIVFIAGLALWLWVGKPAEFYSTNPVLHTKVLLFFVIGAVSLYPTIFFIRNRRSTASIVNVPKMVFIAVRIEIALLLIIPLLAVLMAQGHGLA